MTLPEILALIHAAGSRLPGDTADYEALVDHLAPAVIGMPELLAEATVRAYADPLLGPLVVAAARAYEAQTREVDAAMARDVYSLGHQRIRDLRPLATSEQDRSALERLAGGRGSADDLEAAARTPGGDYRRTR